MPASQSITATGAVHRLDRDVAAAGCPSPATGPAPPALLPSRTVGSAASPLPGAGEGAVGVPRSGALW